MVHLESLVGLHSSDFRKYRFGLPARPPSSSGFCTRWPKDLGLCTVHPACLPGVRSGWVSQMLTGGEMMICF
eukprot:7438774-Pyramimonas_sp.AAC.1